MSPREDYLHQFLPPLDPKVTVGGCRHMCTVKVKMGKMQPEQVSMRYHFVSSLVVPGFLSPPTTFLALQCSICRLKFKHDQKPHDPQTRHPLWNALAERDKEQEWLKRPPRTTRAPSSQLPGPQSRSTALSLSPEKHEHPLIQSPSRPTKCPTKVRVCEVTSYGQ